MGSPWISCKDAEGPFAYKPLATVEYRCFHCRKPTTLLVKSVGDAEAEYWKERYASLMSSLNSSLEQCHVKYGTDPMREDLTKALIKIREDMNRRAPPPAGEGASHG